jgi:hypothetical protein
VADLWIKTLCVLCVLCSDSARLGSQTLVGAEIQRDRFTYHFDNPSSADTPFLVPHFFEQTYDADNVWVIGRVRYPVGGHRWETSGGVTPGRDSTADDYDTFFNPDGTTIVSGTTGGISIRSWRIGQRAEIARRGSSAIFAGYRLRVDRSEFHLGHKTVSRNGVLVEASDVTTRELTRSQLHEVVAGFTVALPLGRSWGVSIDTEIAPVAAARLLVQLPDKYPGQDLTFLAKIGTSTSHVTLARRSDRWGLALVIDAGRTWSYRDTARLKRRTLGFGVVLTR